MTVHYWKSVLVWTVSWKPWRWRRNVTVREKGRKSIIFRPGYFPKALISQRFIYKTLSLLVGLYMHLWMWHLRRRMSREDACLTISLERNDNLFQHIKEAKADQCHPLLMYKKNVIYHHQRNTLLLTVASFGTAVLFHCFSSVAPGESSKDACFAIRWSKNIIVFYSASLVAVSTHYCI